MKFCTRCGQQLGEGHRFCRACGHDTWLSRPQQEATQGAPDNSNADTTATGSVATTAGAEPIAESSPADQERARVAERAERAERAAPSTQGDSLVERGEADDSDNDSQALTADDQSVNERRIARVARTEHEQIISDVSENRNSGDRPATNLGADPALELETSTSLHSPFLGAPTRTVRDPLCPYCLGHFRADVLHCPSCDAEYHPGCWNSYRGCVHAGCDEWRLGHTKGGVASLPRQEPYFS